MSLAAPTSRVFEARNANWTENNKVERVEKESERKTGNDNDNDDNSIITINDGTNDTPETAA